MAALARDFIQNRQHLEQCIPLRANDNNTVDTERKNRREKATNERCAVTKTAPDDYHSIMMNMTTSVGAANLSLPCISNRTPIFKSNKYFIRFSSLTDIEVGVPEIGRKRENVSNNEMKVCNNAFKHTPQIKSRKNSNTTIQEV